MSDQMSENEKNNWQEVRLDEIVKFRRGHDLTVSKIVEGIHPVAGSNGVIGYHHEFTTKGPGITLGRSGNSIGVAHYYEHDFWAHNTTLYSTEFLKSHPKYVFYLLKTIDFYTLNSGSAVPSLNRNHIHSIGMKVPSLSEQKAIAQVLSSLDDKIDLLHRQNKTLEAIAETLFRQQFIEEAQDDWDEGTLESVAENIRCSVKLEDIKIDDRYVGLEHIDRIDVTLKRYGSGSDVNSNKYAFEQQDILFGKLRPYFHKICFTTFLGICSTDILVLRPRSSRWFSFCLFAFFQHDVVEYANLGSGGTRMPRTNWETLKNYPISIPDDESLSTFNNLVLPLVQKMTYNLEQMKILEGLRDALLPKLMSGEVRVAVEPDLKAA